ncbi:MAG: galactokinase family protein [Sulfolobales archaeon]
MSGGRESDYVERVYRGFREFYQSDPSVIVSAPGRIDFLNTHQDYKGLPVVAVGIDLRTYVAISRNLYSDRVVVVSENMRDLGERYVDSFELEGFGLARDKWFGSYVRAAVKSLLIKGYEIKPFNAWIYSTVPVGAGLGSSGTLLVSLIYAVSELYNLRLRPEEVAELAYIAEHDIMRIPCGRLDQYAAAFGGVAYIETKPPYKVHSIDFGKGYFVVLDSGVKHSTADIHPKRQRELDQGLEMLRSIVPGEIRDLINGRYYEVSWEALREEALYPYLHSIPHPYSSRILYTLRAQRSTLNALRVLRGETLDPSELDFMIKEVEMFLDKKIRVKREDLYQVGLIMTYQHVLLSKLYEVSIPVIDEIVIRSVETGGLGAKLSGAGLGGSVVVLARDKGSAEKILRDILDRKIAVRGWIVRIDRGLMTHEISG